MRDSINEVVTGHGYADYKTMLQEALQKGTQGKVTYRTIGESGLDHNKVFEVEVLVDDVPKIKRTGHSKKRLNKMRHILCLNQWKSTVTMKTYNIPIFVPHQRGCPFDCVFAIKNV